MLQKKIVFWGCIAASIALADNILKVPPVTDMSSPSSCAYWQENTQNDLMGGDKHCMQAYLQQYALAFKQQHAYGNHRFSLPIIGGFPAQRLTV